MFLVLLGATATAATGLSEWMLDPGGKPHPEYPREQFYCDVGASPDGRDQARAAALAAVARQVRSEVRTSSSVEIQRKIDENGVVVSGGTQSSASTDVSAYFARADLIRYVAEDTLKKEFYVYACLDRVQAVKSLSHDIGPDLAKFRAGLEQAQAAWASKDVAGFTPSYRAAMAAYQQVAVTASIVHTLAAGASEEAALVGDGAQWLTATRAEAVSGVRMVPVVRGEGLSSAHTKAISEQVQAVLSGMGFIVGGRCEAAAGSVWEVAVDVAPNSKFTSFGRYNVFPTLAVSMRDCARDDAPIAGVLEHPEFKGMSQEEGKALDNAIATITSERLAPGLFGLIEPVFPVENQP